MKKVIVKLFSRFCPPPCDVRSLGWVNVYKRGSGGIMISNMPKKTKQEALQSRVGVPRTTYLRTIEIFEKS